MKKQKQKLQMKKQKMDRTSRLFSTGGNVNYFNVDQFYNRILNTTYVQPYQGLLIVSHEIDPPLLGSENNMISLAIFDLLHRYVFSSINGYCKFNIVLTLKKDKTDKNTIPDEFTHSPCSAIPVTTPDGCAFLSKRNIFHFIKNVIDKVSEKYL